jgi:hypothetical protein
MFNPIGTGMDCRYPPSAVMSIQNVGTGGGFGSRRY